jgi:hypothetical protein
MSKTHSFPESEPDAELLRFAEERRGQSQKRRQMSGALKIVMTPLLRRHGFAGSCPRFRRLGKERYDLLVFLFNKFDNSFLIDIGQCTPAWYRRERSIYFAPERLMPWSLPPSQRAYIQPRPGKLTADCFQYGDAKTREDYMRIAVSVVPFMERAVEMFDNFAEVETLDKR